jgi:hypothetical protein
MVSHGTGRQQRTVSWNFTILPSWCVLVGAGSLWLTFQNLLWSFIFQSALLCPCVRRCPSRGPIQKYRPEPGGVCREQAHISGTPKTQKGINWHKAWPSDWGRLMALKHCPCIAGFYPYRGHYDSESGRPLNVRCFLCSEKKYLALQVQIHSGRALRTSERELGSSYGS